MSVQDHQVITLMLLSILCFVLVMTFLLVFLVMQWRHRKTLSTLNDEPAAETAPPQRPHFSPPHFPLKRPECWLAIKNRDVQAVQSALALHNPQPCSWADGLSGDGERQVFVSPPIAGWILVIGSALPDPAEDVDACFRFLLDLSQKVGQVQYFSANSMFNHHAWAQVHSGRVIRAYAWAGQTLWNQGLPTEAELDLNMRCLGYGEAAESFRLDARETGASNADKVHLLAARWSLNPDEIDERFIGRAWGVAGEASQLF
jgi:hypothetical protein